MLKIATGLTLVLLLAAPTQATLVSTNTKAIDVVVSDQSGHLLDWSRTNQRIKMVMIESPEIAIDKITFTIPGCKKDACGNDSSLILINARKGQTSGVAALRVVTMTKRGVKTIYRVRIAIIKGEVAKAHTQTEFISNQQ